MSPILYTGIIGLAMVIAVACALKLFDINSDFSPLIRKVSVPLAIIISVLNVFVFAMPIVDEYFDLGVFSSTIFVSCLAYFIIGYALSVCIDAIMAKQNNKKKAKPAVVPLTLLDLLGGILAGFGLGACFFSNGIGILAAVAIGLFLIIEKAAIVFRYQGSWTRKQIISNLAITLLVIPIVAACVIWLTSSNVQIGTILLALGCGYLLYRSAFHLFFIAKSYKKS